MKLKLARASISTKPKQIELSKIEEDLEKKSIFYFDKENSHKDLKKLIEYFEDKEYSVYMREVKFGLNDDDFIYEVHIVK
jgi:N12 class adenine-specific DNA methylase